MKLPARLYEGNDDALKLLDGFTGAMAIDHPEKLIELRELLEKRIKAATFPELIVRDDTRPVTTSDFVTVDADEQNVYCPWCGGNTPEDAIEADSLHSVDWEEQWVYGTAFVFDEGTLETGEPSDNNWNTIYWVHEPCGKPVSLPGGWKADWT